MTSEGEEVPTILAGRTNWVHMAMESAERWLGHGGDTPLEMKRFASNLR